jgi:hypothetical protein
VNILTSLSVHAPSIVGLAFINHTLSLLVDLITYARRPLAFDKENQKSPWDQMDVLCRMLGMVWYEAKLELMCHVGEVMHLVLCLFAISSFEQKPMVYGLLLNMLEAMSQVIW